MEEKKSIKDWSISELAFLVHEHSEAYKNCETFVSALSYVRNHNLATYKELLYKECVRCGAIKENK